MPGAIVHAVYDGHRYAEELDRAPRPERADRREFVLREAWRSGRARLVRGGKAMYRLYAAPNTYAMIPHAVLEELGVAYELIWVEIFTDRPDSDFLAASPHARVPALADETGAICEAGAIALYLAERHPGRRAGHSRPAIRAAGGSCSGCPTSRAACSPT